MLGIVSRPNLQRLQHRQSHFLSDVECQLEGAVLVDATPGAGRKVMSMTLSRLQRLEVKQVRCSKNE